MIDIKPIIGWILAGLGFCGFTFLLVRFYKFGTTDSWRGGVFLTFITYCTTGIILGFIFLIVWLIEG